MNEWDFYTSMLLNFSLTPDQVDSLDPDFVENLNARLEAQARIDKSRPKSGGGED